MHKSDFSDVLYILLAESSLLLLSIFSERNCFVIDNMICVSRLMMLIDFVKLEQI